jgi:hypothetical protein
MPDLTAMEPMKARSGPEFVMDVVAATRSAVKRDAIRAVRYPSETGACLCGAKAVALQVHD